MKINWKNFGLSLLYPHLAVIICLLPISVAFLVFSLVYLSSTSIIAILSYLLAFYVLLVVCFRIPRMIEFFKNFKNENKYMQKWFSDRHLRVKASLYTSLIWNVAFAIFQLGLGFYHKSFWYSSMFAYYAILGVARFFLLSHTRKYKAKEEEQMETKKQYLCGWLLLFMNLALAVDVFFIVYINEAFKHHMITTIAMAFFTFVSLTVAIIKVVRYKKYKSPVYSTAKTISLISACVSMLTLETSMLATFGEETSPAFRQIILSLTGVAVVGFAIAMAIMLIIKAKRKLNKKTP